MADDKSQRIVLESEAAMELWRQGKDAWNAWVAANPSADVDFSNQFFEANAEDDNRIPLVDFRDFCFPNGNINFRRAEFDDWSIDFDGSSFGDGNVNFKGANFGNGKFSFSCQFGTGRIIFRYAKFGKGDVSFHGDFGDGGFDFSGARFKDGDIQFCGRFGEGFVNFRYVDFGNGNVRFHESDFGNGSVDFVGSKFGNGDIDFSFCQFRTGWIYFSNCSFGEGEINFKGANFSNCLLEFDNSKLGKGDVIFEQARFGAGSVSLRNLTFEGIARFDDLENLERCTKFSFEGCSFDKLFTFSHLGRMGCPLDLRRTKLAHGVVLNDVKCDYAKGPAPDWTARCFHWIFAWPSRDPPAWPRRKRAADPAWPWRKRAKDPEDSQRFRRLKELAQNENNRAKALEFNAQELRCQRGHESHPLQDFLQFFYMLCSDYGRSVMRPLVGLAVITGLFGLLYARLATKMAFAEAWPAALTYSGGNMFAFVPIGRSALEQSRADLFGDTIPYELLWIAGSQSVLSVILLFLLGLGLRNMFRL